MCVTEVKSGGAILRKAEKVCRRQFRIATRVIRKRGSNRNRNIHVGRSSLARRTAAVRGDEWLAEAGAGAERARCDRHESHGRSEPRPGRGDARGGVFRVAVVREM